MEYSFLNYYGFDYFAAVCGMIAIFFLGNKKREGFIVYMIATASGLVFSILAKSPPIVVTNIVMFILHFRGYLLWKKPETS